MNPSIVTEAIVLKQTPVRDFDRIYTLFTRELGKIGVIAKGVRRPTSRRTSLMQTGNVVKAQLYETHDFFVLREVTLIQEVYEVSVSAQLTSFLFHIVELLDVLLAEAQPHQDIFLLAQQVMVTLLHSPRQVYLRYLEVQMLKRLGYLPGVNSVMLGRLSQQSQLMIEKLAASGIGELEGFKLAEREHQELVEFLHGYIEQAAEKRLKSLGFFSS